MRKEPQGVVFVVDSDETEGQALPGKIYEEITPLMEIGFFQASVDDKLIEDEWGVFLSGYAPLRNGNGRYLVGIDMCGLMRCKINSRSCGRQALSLFWHLSC